MKVTLCVLIAMTCFACAGQPVTGVVVTEASMVRDCRYLETIAENSDPGKLFVWWQNYDGQRKVMARASRLGATHLVWLYDYAPGSAALVYDCD
jgi:hypothetical protein